MFLAGTKLTLEQSLLAVMADSLAFIAWSKTKDGQEGRNRPKSMYSALMGEREQDKEVVAFDSVEEFEEMRRKIVEGG